MTCKLLHSLYKVSSIMNKHFIPSLLVIEVGSTSRVGMKGKPLQAMYEQVKK